MSISFPSSSMGMHTIMHFHAGHGSERGQYYSGIIDSRHTELDSVSMDLSGGSLFETSPLVPNRQTTSSCRFIIGSHLRRNDKDAELNLA